MSKITVFCGQSVANRCNPLPHPVLEVEFAKRIIDDSSNSMERTIHSNSTDFISTMKYYGKKKNVEVEFFLDGVSVGNDIEPVFKDLNRALDLINKITG